MTHQLAKPPHRALPIAWRSLARTLGAALLAAPMSFAGCGHSAPTHYLTLDATGAGAGMPLSTRPMAPVQLSAVHIPAVLDRPEVVTQTGPNRLKIDDTARWGAPLAQMMRSALAQNLEKRLPAGAFVFPDAPAPAGTRTLVVTVLDCETTASATLTLQASWALLSGQPVQTSLTQQATLNAEVTGQDAAAQAAALSRVLGELSDRIAASINGR
ncbi:membrane integrity-associated transporter subunit PqiC [Paraburkholderia mimosarum]|uniref:PqiC family protein n=1 Tax=Paraburkholderia mimosarum TaxID=312026 RepID=UPI0004189B65|nr:PqiC family protein [Paraburkholderia mimosarum]